MHHAQCRSIPLLALAVLLVAAGVAQARVKLITLPVRERVAVHLDHASATLVEEERIVPLNQGVNKVDFSWANTHIDPRTIVFRVIKPIPGEQANGEAENDEDDAQENVQPQQMQVNVLSVSYPPDEKALVWDVASNMAGSARVRISYLLGGLDKSFNYRAIAAHDESTLTLSQYIRVKNFAGEQYADTDITAGLGESFQKPIGTDETKEMLVRSYQQVPIRKTYTADAATFEYLDRAQDKLRIPMHYVLVNDEAHQLGQTPLNAGKVRIFQKDRPDDNATTAFLGEDWGAFTPIDDEMRLYLGVAQDVVVHRRVADRRVRDADAIRRTYDVVIEYEIENFKDQAVTLDVAEQIEHVMREANVSRNRPPEWEIGERTTFEAAPDAERTNQQQVVYHADLPARDGDEAEKVTRRLHLVFRNVW